MGLQAGQTLLHYRLIEQIGEGGMGVVWKAIDTSLGREVAIKVLPETFASDAERLARFEREAKLLASLNHPNIAIVYGLHHDAGLRFLAMELIAGEDMSQRLARGPLPQQQAYDIAGQVVEALHAAHESGVIHRDLKPANIQLQPDGKVKVLDFGLAKGIVPTDTAGDPSLSPTVTSLGTVAGVIVGTAAYMSPEQARGQDADRRADVWAFGCLLYEMLTRTRPFSGDTVSDTLASVLKIDPDWEALPADTPPAVQRLLRRCLAKSRRKRLHDIADARLELEDAASEAPESVHAAAPSTPGWTRAVPWIVALGAVIVAGAAFLRPAERVTPQAPLARFDVKTGTLDWTTGALPFAVSPDGRTLVYSATAGTTTQLYQRPLDQRESTPIPDTEDAHAPFFSPDGQWLGFVAGGELKKLAMIGGKPITLCPVPHSPGGATWTDDDTIIFATAWANAGLSRVSAAGGNVESLTEPDRGSGELYHRAPQILPDQKHVLFTVARTGQAENAAVLSLDTGEWRLLTEIKGRARFVAGQLLYGESSTLLAVPFDAKQLQPVGEPRILAENVPARGGASAVIDAAPGVLVIDPAASGARQLVWVDRQGRREVLPFEHTEYDRPSLSLDGRKLAVGCDYETDGVTAIIDLERGSRQSLNDVTTASWTPRGELIFTSSIGGVPNLYRMRASAGSPRELLLPRDRSCWASHVSPDGKYLVYYEQHPETSRDIWVLALDGDGAGDGGGVAGAGTGAGAREPEPFLVTPANERSPQFSPDGKWIAYVSNKSGRDEVYLRRFEPRADEDHLVSVGGGREPVFGLRSNEIFYRSGNVMMAVSITLEPEFSAGDPQPLFELDWANNAGGMNQMYTVAPDGERFLMIENAGETGHVHVVLGWETILAQPER